MIKQIKQTRPTGSTQYDQDTDQDQTKMKEDISIKEALIGLAISGAALALIYLIDHLITR